MPSRSPTRQAIALRLALTGAITLLTACVHADHHGRVHSAPAHGVHSGHGPPPHAPAHGHRQKLNHHGGVQISFDSGIGAYVVGGHADVFFWDDHFYRWHVSGWQTSVGLDSGWISIGTAKLPGHLSKKHGKGHGHLPTHYPAKGEHDARNDRREHERERAKDERERDHEAAKAHREHEREYGKDRKEHERERAKDERERQREAGKAHREHGRKHE